MTKRPCQSNMGFLDREMSIRPNATTGYLDASITVRTNKSDLIERMGDVEREKVFGVARKLAEEEIESNKKALKEHVIARKALLEKYESIKKLRR